MIPVILNLTAFCLLLLTSVFAFSFCLFILLQRRHRQDLELFLCANTFFAAFMLSLSLFSDTVNALKVDFNIGYDDDSIMCRLQAYILYVSGAASFSSYCLQAASRLIHVVYRQHLWLRTFKVHLLAVIFSWVLACLCICPYLIIENFFIYLPGENYCQVDIENLIAMIYTVSSACGIQYGSVGLIYFRMVIFLKHSVMRNANRELAVFKRMFYTILTMGGMTMPAAIFWVIYLCTGYLHPMAYRVQLLSYSIGTLMMNGGMIFINPRLRKLVFVRQRRVAPLRQPAAVEIPI